MWLSDKMPAQHMQGPGLMLSTTHKKEGQQKEEEKKEKQQDKEEKEEREKEKKEGEEKEK